ncbi:MAG: 3-deoxy-manno-octulosonate cytidylyltransferase [Rhodospirillaceae bacterium]|jgi:3-deoxy-manno-octulosonate cytidylyltransferase (CMP-KDO synthetase)|nr:3-deoxy-manno-octulosonate cytidylyltransferase [Rhodospirillaceae bacterium]MBT4219678.1 3-deoxy-manno-octulosonate cytidylyltransferase [Rhodospirillaceae bacterium]MBT4464340.1 3-deoxy-manno-octulosonate cytidylyltransferase [Rhodospirillaceae bacterium]MBT5309532.1 3-deoxy-manno-octulosonate cytidylyltransferase [Rhodospirillaceae bacterium]MBT6407335.1 3-deoxy-manno-octulosonate cytidylyltransferase [Rhodospirillaceae bacterium]
MKTIGIVPARMAASRFPGKPLHLIGGRPMLEHCFERAKMFGRWDGLFLATCDEEIREFGESKGYPVIMTADTHTRALDRVAEAADTCGMDLGEDDNIVCVQGDEPLLGPDVIEAVVAPLEKDDGVKGTMLGVPIVDEALYLNPDIVKIVHDLNGDVMYTSRSPIPYAKEFTPELGAMRVGGIFGFKRNFLKWFTETPESPLEIRESCDSNRVYDNGFKQRLAPVPYRPYFSVDSPEDVALVEAALEDDALWGKY